MTKIDKLDCINVGELKKLLSSHPDETPVVYSAHGEDGDSWFPAKKLLSRNFKRNGEMFSFIIGRKKDVKAVYLD